MSTMDDRDLPQRLRLAEEAVKRLTLENERLRGDAMDRLLLELHNIRREVFKTGSGYSGPGVILAVFFNHLEEKRYVVAHTIEGGTGQFYHIYSEKELTFR